MLTVNVNQGIAEIALDRPPANALTTELVLRLHEAHRRACADRARAVILTGRPGMFSGGLDVPALLPLPRPAIAGFWRVFFELTRGLATSPVPVVAALSGHAPAGGAVLAIHCDYRLAARGAFKIGLNEVAVGLPVPDCIMLSLASVVGARAAQRLAMTAQLLTMEEALAVGLVDELAEPEGLMERAREWTRQLIALPPIAMNRTRQVARAALAAALRPEADAELATDLWFSAETQAGMRALVERLAKR